MNLYGFRNHKVFENATSGVIDPFGAYGYLEVTAATATKFYPNAFEVDGVTPSYAPRDGIPLAAGITRVIPMQVYNFKADAAVTVVAYKA